MSEREAKAITHLVRAKQLLADLDRDARGTNVDLVRAGVKHEVSAALEALQSGVTGNRDGKVRKNAATTSRGAAKRIKVKSGTQRARVLLAIAGNSHRFGATDYELCRELGIKASSLRPRRGELVDEGYVTAGELVKSREHEGSDWTVWTVTASGQALAYSLAREARPAPPPPGEQLSLA
jgi:hypothetical protein